MAPELISQHKLTSAAADWWSVHSYGLELPALQAVIDTAKRIAAGDGRDVVCRGDFEAAVMQVGG